MHEILAITDEQAEQLELAKLPYDAYALARMASMMLIPSHVRGCVEVRPSVIHGRGLFATEVILPNELITMYPPHIAMLTLEDVPGGRKVAVHAHQMIESRLELPDDALERVRQLCAIGEFRDDYKFDIAPTLAIFGLPEVQDDPRLLGHLVNDAVHTPDRTLYAIAAPALNNGRFSLLHRLYVGVVATRRIEVNEEILVAYGNDYWSFDRHL